MLIIIFAAYFNALSDLNVDSFVFFGTTVVDIYSNLVIDLIGVSTVFYNNYFILTPNGFDIFSVVNRFLLFELLSISTPTCLLVLRSASDMPLVACII